jgi:hypothetical protein
VSGFGDPTPSSSLRLPIVLYSHLSTCVHQFAYYDGLAVSGISVCSACTSHPHPHHGPSAKAPVSM